MNEKTFPVPLCSTVEGMQWLYNTATDNFIRGLRDANAELAALRAENERLRTATEIEREGQRSMARALSEINRLSRLDVAINLARPGAGKEGERG